MEPFAPGPLGTDEVLYARMGAVGRIRLNRPQALNALTHPIINSIRQQLDVWADDPTINTVAIEGAGDRGLCAGGDIRAMRDTILNDPEHAARFWADEYRLNLAISEFPKPYVAFMDGITMGGGIGVSTHGSFRIATDRSRIAMPETKIGFSPDVGAMYRLARTPGELGTYLALTGNTIDGSDAVYCGLADVVVSHTDIDDIRDQLAAGTDPDNLNLTPLTLGSSLADKRDWIDACFTGDDPVAIIDALRHDTREEARDTADLLEARSPLSVAVALEAIRRAANLTLAEVLDQDTMLARNSVGNPDFVEGVRALLIDRDNDPKWQHDSINDVTYDDVKRMFVSG
ncbi:enoyl-CoA hydratase/isomerase family protein [Haloglycomyces albus]|uniref:enoyl-CoA hydratase/isomerase family protein n=1 Tax=Haloglycomyces albus TaxID=526067 RepID=UPI00046D1200|nr:enoyl-CoA hydratase/isomerase family protein [Haloglycomyces albus]